MFEIFVISE